MGRQIYRYKIDTLNVVPFNASYNDGGVPGFDVSTNGSFYCYDPKAGLVPVGPTILPGTKSKPGLKTSGAAAYSRGAVAIVNGQVKVGLVESSDHWLSKAVSDFGGQPSLLMGGGFLLVGDGGVRKDLTSNQHYDAKQGQLRDTNHILIGTTKSDAHLIIAINAGLVGEFGHIFGSYQNLVCFDGGRAFWVRSKDGLKYDYQDAPFFAAAVKGSRIQ